MSPIKRAGGARRKTFIKDELGLVGPRAILFDLGRGTEAGRPGCSRKSRHLMAGKCLLAPILCTVPDVQNFHDFVGISIYGNEGLADKFTRSFHFSTAAQTREGRQSADMIQNGPGDLSSSFRIVFSDIRNGSDKLIGGLCCPPNLPHEWNSRSIRSTTSW